MRNTTNAFQVYNLTDSTALLGLTFLFQGLPGLVMGLFGGTLADILPRRTLIRSTMSLNVLVASLLAILTFSGLIQVWHIYALTFISASLSAVEGPARGSLIPQLVPRELILNATALQSTAMQTSLLLGPLLGGGLIDTIGAGWAYTINALLILPAIVAISLLRHREDANRRKIRLNISNIFEGLRFAFATRVLMAFLLLDAVTMLLGYYPAMMPVFARDVLDVGALGLGALLAAAPVGSLLGLFVILAIGNIQRKGLLILAATVLHGVVLVAFASSTWFVLSLVLVALLGLLDSMSVSVRQTSFQLLATDENRGRVLSTLGIFAIASNNFGGTYLGFASEVVGPQHALILGGLGGLGFALLIAITLPKVREFKA